MGFRGMRGRQGNDAPSSIMLVVLIIGVVIIGVILMLLVRVQRGLLGILLAALASGLLIYWLREVRGIVKNEFSGGVTRSKPEWAYDLLEMKDEVTLVADVPGPDEEIKVHLEGEKLEIRGGNNFFKTVTLPKVLDILTTNYRNGVLEIKLKREASK